MFGQPLMGRMERVLLTMALPLLALSLAARSAWGIDVRRMERDLAVTESVFAQLCAHESPAPRPVWGDEPSVAAIHVEGYGVVLVVQGCLTSGGGPMVIVDRLLGGPGTSVRRFARAAGDTAQNADSAMVRTRSLIADFLGSYGDAIGQLEPADRVAVLVRPRTERGLLTRLGVWASPALPLPPEPPLPPAGFESDRELGEPFDELAERLQREGVLTDSVAVLLRRAARRTKPWPAGGRFCPDTLLTAAIEPVGDAPAPPRLLAASVTRADLEAHRRGQLSDEQFRDRIAFSEHELGTRETVTVDIMGDILARSIAAGEGGEARRGEGSLSVYCPGLGALFVLDEPSGRLAGLGRLVARDDGEPERERAALVQRRREQFTEAMAEYGATVRPLQDEERLIVVLRLSQAPRSGQAQRLTLSARRADLDAYRRGRLDLAQFAQRVAVQEP